MERVVVGLSGGVDSSVAAYLLKEQGYEVVGMFMRNWHDTTGVLKGNCPFDDDRDFAEMVARKLRIPFEFVDLSNEYRQRVVDYMFNEYSKGRTPNPDVLCNREIKFDAFVKAAFELGADYVATGHYCRKQEIEVNGQTYYRLLTGTDSNKDQSYFLAGLSAEQLRAVIFPLGSWTKPEVRAMAAAMGLPGADAPESQDACLVPEGQSFAEALRIRFHGEARRGKMIADEGQSLGMHEGIHHFTIGQRRGLAVETSGRVWVERIDEATGEVRVTSDEARLYSAIFTVADVAWINDPPRASIDCLVQARYRAATVPCRVEMDERPGTNACAGGHDRVRVLLREPMRAIAPGQAAVFYDGERALGRGWIESVEGTGGK